MNEKILLLKISILSNIFSFCWGKSCTDIKQTSAASPKGLKEVPVVLMIATLGSDVRLPCRYCDESANINSRIWRRRNLKGEEEEVALDMHDNEMKNRVVADKDHSLIIRDLTEEDGAYYFCYEVGDNDTGSMKMDILLDKLPANIEREVPKILKVCKKIKTIPALSNYECYSEWGSWSQCDVCGKVGKRKRVGACRLQKFAKAEIETPEGKTVEANFPIVGIGCHSVMLDVLPKAKAILYQIPNIVLVEKCEVSCENYVAAVSEMTAYKKSSFLKKIKLKSLQSKKSGTKAITSEVKEEVEGAPMTFFCPGSNLDTRVKWKFGKSALNPEKIKQKTNGRISIDATDALHIKELRVTDAGEYICMLYEAEVGIIRLKVSSKLTVFDPTSNFGILTTAIMLSFVLWITLMALKWKSYKLQQEVHKKRAERKVAYTAVPLESEYGDKP